MRLPRLPLPINDSRWPIARSGKTTGRSRSQSRACLECENIPTNEAGMLSKINIMPGKIGREDVSRLCRLSSPITKDPPPAVRDSHRADILGRRKRPEHKNIPTNEAGKLPGISEIAGNAAERGVRRLFPIARRGSKAQLCEHETQKNIPTNQAGMSFVHSEMPGNFPVVAGGPASGEVEERL
jgi:hypothetical protein